MFVSIGFSLSSHVQKTIIFQEVTVVDALLLDFAVMWNVCEERELLHICIVTIKKYFWTMDLHTLFGFLPMKRLLVNRPNNNKNQRRFSHDNNALDLHAMVSSDFSVLKL